MKSLFDTKISFYSDVEDNVGTEISLRDFLFCDKYKEQIEHIRSITNEEQQKSLKKQLPLATISGTFAPTRKADNLVAHSNLLCVDIDKKDNMGVPWFDNLKNEWQNIPQILYAAHSVRGEGWFAIFHIAYPEKHLAHFEALQRDFAKSCFTTQYVWLATGKEQATSSDLLPLEGKSVVVFPNKGEYSKWQEMLQTVPNLQFHISDVMEKAQGDCHTIAQMVLSQQPLRPTEAEAALIRMEDANPNLALLVKALDLEVVGFLPISDNVKNGIPKTKPASKEPKEHAVMQSILLAQEKRWHGRNPECHKCHLSHEGINGTYCGKLHRYVEYGKGDCGIEAEKPPAPE